MTNSWNQWSNNVSNHGNWTKEHVKHRHEQNRSKTNITLPDSATALCDSLLLRVLLGNLFGTTLLGGGINV